MTRAQRRTIEKLKKKHHCSVATRENVSTTGALLGDDVEVILLTDKLHEDERTKIVLPSGLATEPVDLEDLRGAV